MDEYDTALHKEGWSVRFLRPQEHDESLSRLVSSLDDVLGCNVGVNSYWTPPNSQGFAAHYDDVDVFMLQLEGRKVWSLYPPPLATDVLARFSSADYDPKATDGSSDFLKGPPAHTVVLEAGDTLYLPRGWVHQGHTKSGALLTPPKGAAAGSKVRPTHSLHVTVSAYQLLTHVDLIHAVLRDRLERLAAKNVELRHTLPRVALPVRAGEPSPGTAWWWDSLGSTSNPKMMGPFNAVAAVTGAGTAAAATRGDDDKLPSARKRARPVAAAAAPASATAVGSTRSEVLLALRQSLISDVRRWVAQLNDDVQRLEGPIDRGADIVARDIVFKRQPPLPPPAPSTQTSHNNSTLPVDAATATWIRVQSPFHCRASSKTLMDHSGKGCSCTTVA